MTKKEIQLPRKIINQLLHSAQISPNKEICGLIGAKDTVASTCYPVENCAEQPEVRFQLDSKQQIDCMAKMRDGNEQLFAIYHSHPKSPAVPSATDIELATHPDAIHLIISLSTKGVLEIRGFKIIDKAVEELAVSLFGY